MNRILPLALVAIVLLARPAAAQTRRVVFDNQLSAALQGELALKNGDYLLLQANGQNVPAYNGSPYNNRVLGFDSRGLALAYEHFWNDHWSAGAVLQHESFSGSKYLIPELLLRHRSAIGPLTFGQRLSGYRTIGVGNVGRSVGQEGLNYLALRANLEKLFPLGSGGVALRPRISYEAAMHITLQKDKNAPDVDERTIQQTQLRIEVGCRLSNHFDFTPWFAYQTAYYFAIAQYNPISGTPTADPGRLNLVTPVFGIDARFTLFEGKTVFERRQLPTQH